MKGRATNARTSEQDAQTWVDTEYDKRLEERRTAHRLVVLSRMDIAEIRAWLETEGFGAFGEDSTVLQSAHEARILDKATQGFLKKESIAWLKEHAPQSEALLTDREIVRRMRRA